MTSGMVYAEVPIHDSLHEYVRELNKVYLSESALFEMDNDIYGFEWIDGDNSEQNVLSFLRRAKRWERNTGSSKYVTKRIRGLPTRSPKEGTYKEILSSNLEAYDGTGKHNPWEIESENIGCHRREQSIVVYVPPLSATAFKIL